MSHEINRKDYVNFKPPVPLASGRDRRGNHKILSVIVDALDPSKSHYEVHDFRDQIDKFDTFDAAMEAYNNL